MRVKLLSGDLNPSPYPLHPASTYTCEVTITPKVCGGVNWIFEYSQCCLGCIYRLIYYLFFYYLHVLSHIFILFIFTFYLQYFKQKSQINCSQMNTKLMSLYRMVFFQYKTKCDSTKILVIHKKSQFLSELFTW